MYNIEENNNIQSNADNYVDIKTFKEEMKYMDKKQDSRTDYITGQLKFTNFLLFIIAIPHLIDIIMKVITLLGAGALISSIFR